MSTTPPPNAPTVKPLVVCMGCPRRLSPAEGSIACGVLPQADRRDIRQHARHGYCPHPDGPRFGDGERPAGWSQLPVLPAAAAVGPPRPSTMGEDGRQLVALMSRNLGDEVELLARAIGADRLARAFEEITGWNCGCDARKKLLNKLPSLAATWGWACRLVSGQNGTQGADRAAVNAASTGK